MLYVQISACQGPVECELAVVQTLQALMRSAQRHHITLDLVESTASTHPHGLKSALLMLSGQQVTHWLETWQGTILWQFKSPIRPHHQRKNWFVGVFVMNVTSTDIDPTDVQIETLKSQGAGGQHVNKTRSAIRLVHNPTGISVLIQSERSQHANKKQAFDLLNLRLQQYEKMQKNHNASKLRHQHYELQRGNPVRQFKVQNLSY